jgi:phage terminase small subunit
MAGSSKKTGGKPKPKADRKPGALSPKQQRFVAEYLIDLNGTQAAIRAGYSRKTACEQAARLLANAKVAEAVAAGKADRGERLEITADRVLQELALIAFSDLSESLRVDVYGRILVNTLDELPPRVRRCIESIKQVTTEIPDGEGGTVERVQLSVKLHSKVAALGMLTKHLGLEAPKKHEHTMRSWADFMVEQESNGA